MTSVAEPGEGRVARIERCLREALDPEDINIIDDSAAHVGHVGAASGGGHFNVLIVSELFSGKSMLQRHRMVYDAVGEMMKSDIHALSVKALTPDEF